MEKSATLKGIGTALQTFHVKMGKISKDAQNPFFRSKYATLSNILEQIQMPLAESGLVFTQFPTSDNTLTTILIHTESGEFIQGSYNITPVKGDPQSVGSAITYARRYALGAILGLNIDDDDDGNKASGLANSGNATNTPQAAYNNTDDARPWITEAALEKAIARVNAGEVDIIDKTKSAFRMKKEYRERLEAAAKVPF